MAGEDAAEALLAESALETPEQVQPALREDQIQNAITFLSHPKVRSLSRSPAVRRAQSAFKYVVKGSRRV